MPRWPRTALAVSLCLAVAVAAHAQGIRIDPEFRTLQPLPRPEPDLAPPLPEPPTPAPPRSLFGGGVTAAPTTLDQLDQFDPHAWLRGDGGSQLYTGERLETPVPADRLGATVTIPF